MSHDDARTGDRRTATGRRGRSSRWIRPLGWVGLAAGFVLLVATLSKLLASGGHTALGMTLEIVPAVVAVLLIAQGADGLRPGSRQRGRALRH